MSLIHDISQEILILFNNMNQMDYRLDMPLSESGINSMNFVQFIIAIEDKFEIDMEDRYLNIEIFHNLLEVADVVVNYVLEKRDCDV